MTLGNAFNAIFTIVPNITDFTAYTSMEPDKERVICMATKSILKNVDIKDKKLGKSLVIALENAAGKRSRDVQLSRTYEDVRGDKLRSILGK